MLALDPKRAGRPSADNCGDPLSLFAPNAWGSYFKNLEGLETFQLELETVEEKKEELDAIVLHAPGWQFALNHGHVMIMDPYKTKRTGWMGAKLGTYNPPSSSGFAYFANKVHKGGAGTDDFSYNDEGNFLWDEDNQRYISSSEWIGGSNTGEIGGTRIDSPDSDYQSMSASSAELDSQKPNTDTPDPSVATAKGRLLKAGVNFDDVDAGLDYVENNATTYYVVTLTWQSHVIQ